MPRRKPEIDAAATTAAATTAEPLPLASPDKPPPDAAAIEQVRKWVIAGHSEHDILDAIGKTYPNADTAALIAHAMVSLQRAAKWHPEVVAGFIFEATRDVYRKALEVMDFAVALRALKQLAEYVPSPQDEDDDAAADTGGGEVRTP